MSSGWITSPSLSKFGGSYPQGFQTCPFSVGVCSLSWGSWFWGAGNSPSSAPLCYNESCIAQGSRARTWGSWICWQSWPVSCQAVLPKICGYYLSALIITLGTGTQYMVQTTKLLITKAKVTSPTEPHPCSPVAIFRGKFGEHNPWAPISRPWLCFLVDETLLLHLRMVVRPMVFLPGSSPSQTVVSGRLLQHGTSRRAPWVRPSSNDCLSKSVLTTIAM